MSHTVDAGEGKNQYLKKALGFDQPNLGELNLLRVPEVILASS
jgi:hypothetical protein